MTFVLCLGMSYLLNADRKTVFVGSGFSVVVEQTSAGVGSRIQGVVVVEQECSEDRVGSS